MIAGCGGDEWEQVGVVCLFGTNATGVGLCCFLDSSSAWQGRTATYIQRNSAGLKFLTYSPPPRLHCCHHRSMPRFHQPPAPRWATGQRRGPSPTSGRSRWHFAASVPLRKLILIVPSNSFTWSLRCCQLLADDVAGGSPGSTARAGQCVVQGVCLEWQFCRRCRKRTASNGSRQLIGSVKSGGPV
jgi:hypothetical protein